MALALFNILVFPGLAFLVISAFAAEFFDRKLYARLQNRVGPPWFQPVADFLKLMGKEDVVPEEANPTVFKLVPIFAVAAAAAAFLYVPLWRAEALSHFEGDIIVTLYLFTIPTLALFLGGWYSTSLYSKIGAVRSLTQLFAYEAPLFMSILSPALFADTWCMSEMASFYAAHPWYWLVNLPGLGISIFALLGKLEKVPFDIAEAETEIVAGTLTEYSGRLLGFFKLAINIEMVVGASILAAVFLPFGLRAPLPLAVLLYAGKVLAVISVLSLSRAVFARLRIDQMMRFCWRHMAPAAFLQLMLDMILKGVLPR
jgi:NADH-quinone oxidoreductase subunit H